MSSKTIGERRCPLELTDTMRALSRTARVTPAPAPASSRAVSTPMPDAAPVTIARLPDRSTAAATSAAVDSKLNGVVMSCAVLISVLLRDSLFVAVGADRQLGPLVPQRQSPRVLLVDDLQRPVAEEHAQRRVLRVDDLEDRRSGGLRIAPPGAPRGEHRADLRVHRLIS